MKTSVPTIARTGAVGTGVPSKPQARYLRDTRSGVIDTRGGSLRDHREDVRASWARSAGLAMDLIQNSGRLKGASDQVIADTVGVELQLAPKPDLSKLGYDEKETAEFVSLVRGRFKLWAWNARECDQRGKFTLPQMVDISLRWQMAYGEATALMNYMSRAERKRYGIATGTKLCLTPPTRLTRHTDASSEWFEGVRHDGNGRPVSYRFSEKANGFSTTRDYAAYDGRGLPQVLHIFDPVDALDVRGISPMAAGFRKHIQHEMLDDATLQTAILQTVFAAVLTSAAPSAEAFEAIEAIKDSGDGGSAVAQDYLNWFAASLTAAREGKISVSGDPVVSHLAPGEDLRLQAAQTPSGQYLPFSQALARDMARAIGISFAAFTMDHTDATYSSVRMENASIWPVVMRRRQRLAAPLCQSVYEAWLDEEIGEGRIPFKGGYAAFAANRQAVCWALWQGPPKPTADDLKSAKAATERLENGTSTLSIEATDSGLDQDELFEIKVAEHKRHIAAGLPSPFVKSGRGGPANEGGGADDPKRQAA